MTDLEYNMFSQMPLKTIDWATDISVVHRGEMGCHSGNFDSCKKSSKFDFDSNPRGS